MSEGVWPTGTVTFLFSDMERSTQLVQELGTSEFTTLLEQHHRILRAAFAGHGGIERGTEGDSFLVVFADAGAAVDAAVGAQVALATASWPDNASVRVRMGIHTGSGTLGGDDYVGVDINRAARIASAAHGGQVLISDATRALVANRLPDGVRTKALGAYRLKDLPGAEHLWQLEIHGIPAVFPPLRALDVRRAHIPPEATTFIGREAELNDIARLIGAHQLVTLTGPGGSGKTRLAIRTAAQVAEGFADGAVFVGLASISTADQLIAAITSTLGLPNDGSRPTRDVLLDWIIGRDIALVLDNLEQIADAGKAVDDLLTSAPGMRVLATSRSRLRIAGEQEFPVPPLTIPGPNAGVEVLRASESVRLFVDRARLVLPGLTPTGDDLLVVGDICSRLDGLPLAIELAAARVRLLPLAAIRDRLRHRLDALVGGPATVPHRQQSLREAIGWSHDLLDGQGKALFRRLAVFISGWTVEAAQEICGGIPVADVEQGLEMLVDQSLVQATPVHGEARFTMLETIGEFAQEQLNASGEEAELRRRHWRFFRRLAEDAHAGPGGSTREARFNRLEADLENLRAAIARAVDEGDPVQSLGIAAALRAFWLERNHSAEGLQTLVSLSEAVGIPDGPEFARATAAGSAISTWLGDYATSRRMGKLSVAAWGRLEDRWGFADAVSTLAFAMIEVDPREALALNAQGLTAYRELGDIDGEGQALLGRATAEFALGQLSETRETLERSLELLRQAGDGYFALFCSIFLGRIKLLTGDVAAGMSDYRDVLQTSRQLDLLIGVAAGLDYIAEVAIWSGDVSRAVRLGATAARIKEELGGGVPPRIGGALDPLEVGRDTLSPESFEREAAAGRAMDIGSAVDEALEVEPGADLLPPTP
jgi:predicted ATPase/class 3 adenylate cyclase